MKLLVINQKCCWREKLKVTLSNLNVSKSGTVPGNVHYFQLINSLKKWGGLGGLCSYYRNLTEVESMKNQVFSKKVPMTFCACEFSHILETYRINGLKSMDIFWL
jgi:hypothetical protein